MSEPLGTNLLFVYGTLRRGYFNHAQYMETARYLGTARTEARYSLYADFIPYLVKTPSTSQVVGELYQVDSETLAILDEFEGHPDEYRRELAPVETQQGRSYMAWVYFSPLAVGELVASGDYRDYAVPGPMLDG